MKMHLWLPVLLVLVLPAFGAEIPTDLDQQAKVDAGSALRQAGLPADEACVKAETLDRTELAELSQSDLDQKGGDAIITVVVIAAIVALVYIFFQHTERMNAPR